MVNEINPGAPGCNTRAANHLKIAFSLFYSFFSKLAKGSKPGKFPSLSNGLSEILKGEPPKAKEAHERPLPMRRTSIPGRWSAKKYTFFDFSKNQVTQTSSHAYLFIRSWKPGQNWIFYLPPIKSYKEGKIKDNTAKVVHKLPIAFVSTVCSAYIDILKNNFIFGTQRVIFLNATFVQQPDAPIVWFCLTPTG